MAKAIMVQGTMSNAGKSLVTAGLCRIFRQDGYSAAPFKSQNMALNSFITREGLEMGRAQVMQAEAAGIEPSVLMNPILLKPVSDAGSQIIVNGEVLGNMPAVDYYRYKKNLVPHILQAYNTLAESYDIIVLEGAGSPAEINLKDEDIVNMGMAKMAQAPVLLVGDIDRGGVFASLYGTVELLEPGERKMVKGIIINKFRGDVEILRPGLAMLEKLIRIPVLGVIPYTRIEIDDEDSLSQRLEQRNTPVLVDIAVIRLPHIANFTDFNPLEQFTGVGIRYVRSVRELQTPDLLILPGTKNTIGDLLWLRSSGLEARILKLVEQGVPLLGICGGYQMLGRSVCDPAGMECQGEIRGLGLLPVDTVFEQQKTRTRVKGKIKTVGGVLDSLSDAPFEGYEIHMGQTTGQSSYFSELVFLSGGEPRPDGAVAGNVYGTYVHGLLDSPKVATALIQGLFKAKGIDASAVGAVDSREFKEQQYDLLAEILRKSLDMEAVYQILEEGL